MYKLHMKTMYITELQKQQQPPPEIANNNIKQIWVQ